MKAIVVSILLLAGINAFAGDVAMTPEQIAQEMKYAEELRKLDFDQFADMADKAL